MGGIRLAAASLLALTLAACGMHVLHDPWKTYPVNLPPAPVPVHAPSDMPAFNYAPLTPQALMAHVERLASDEFEGRAPGTHGEELTVDYITRAFQAAGLQPGVPVGNRASSWEQVVPMVTRTLANQPALAIGPGIDLHPLTFGDDFVVWNKTGQEHVALENAEIVFVGYGIVRPDLSWNDYAGVDMHGKIALILVNDPDLETGDDRGFSGRAMSYYGRWTYKFEEAARQGAAGALIIHEQHAAGYPWSVVRTTYTGPQRDLLRADAATTHAPVEGWVTEQVARDWLARSGHDFGQEKVRAQRPDFTPLPLGLAASVSLDTRSQTMISRNIVGVLPGAGHARGEAVIYSAHWDHLGHCPAVNNDDICNGAIDNASGVAGLIEMARRFAQDPRRQRSLLFIAFTGEESNLLGSTYYTENAVFPLTKTAAEINLEGLSTFGPARDITLIGAGQTDLEDVLTQAATAQSRTVTEESNPENGAYFRSDQFAFARLGVPVLITAPGLDLYGGGLERGRALMNVYLQQRYHRPGDQYDPAWDMSGALRDLQILHAVGAQVADSSDWPQWRESSPYYALRSNTLRR